MLILYYKPTCPFCQRVLGEAEEMGVTFNLKDVSADDSLREELIEKGGKKQVPFLIDEDRGESMYESGDIVEYLRQHYAKTSNNGVRVHRSDAACDVCE